MFRLLKNKYGQAMTVQYGLMFFFVVAVVVAMTTFFKRTLQGRIRDATVYMSSTVHNVYDGNVPNQYEPYYLDTTLDRLTKSAKYDQLTASFNLSSGVFFGADASNTVTSVFSNQAPPGLAR